MPTVLEVLAVLTGTPAQIQKATSRDQPPTTATLGSRPHGTVDLGAITCVSYNLHTDLNLERLLTTFQEMTTIETGVTAHVGWADLATGDSGYRRLYGGRQVAFVDGHGERRLPIIVLAGPQELAAAFDPYGRVSVADFAHADAEFSITVPAGAARIDSLVHSTAPWAVTSSASETASG